MTEVEQERDRRRIAAVTTFGINVLLLVLLLFVVAWRTPNPPHPEVGIELNFGMDAQGTGSVQPKEPVSSQAVEQEQPKENIEEVAETPPKADEGNKPAEQEVVTTQESPVTVKEEKQKSDEKPVNEKQETKKQPTQPEVKKEPVADPNALFKPNNTNKGAQTSHGDDTDKAGDKGNPDGELDKDALYGKKGGGGGGSTLDLHGWQWDTRPNPTAPSHEMGGIVKFEIKVDNNGDIISIRTLERSVSPETEQVCKRAVEKLTFTKTGVNVPSVTTGTITFVVRSK